jgi:hypothetical protein
MPSLLNGLEPTGGDRMKEEGMFERIEHIVTNTAPKPSGHYSQATTLGELLFGCLIEIDAIASRRLEGARTDQVMTSKHRPEQS